MKAWVKFANSRWRFAAVCAAALALSAGARAEGHDIPPVTSVTGVWTVTNTTPLMVDGAISFAEGARVAIAKESQFAAAASNGVAIAVATCGIEGSPSITNYNFSLKMSGRIDLRGGSCTAAHLQGAPDVTNAATFCVAGVWTLDDPALMTVDGALRFASGSRVEIADASLFSSVDGAGVAIATATRGIAGMPTIEDSDYDLKLSADGKSLIIYEARPESPDWSTFSKKVTVTFAGIESGVTLTNFPALVRLSSAIDGFSYADFRRDNGGDLRFADSNGSFIPHEIETWDTNGVSTVWVKVPRLSAGATVTAYYGSRRPVVAAMDAKDVWDSDYLAVWHMDAESGGLSQEDSTANGKAVSCSADCSDCVQSGVAGRVGLAARCGVKDDSLLGGYGCADYGFFNGHSNLTVEAWTYQDVGADLPSVNVTIIENSSFANPWNYGWSMYEAKNSKKIGFWLYSKEKTDGLWLSAPATDPAQGEWHYHARRWSGESGVDSRTLDATTDSSTGVHPDQLKKISDSTLCIGNRTTSIIADDKYAPFRGVIDEVRVSKVARSDAWIKATYDTIAGQGFATYAVGIVEPTPVHFAKEVNVAFTGYSGAALTNFPALVRLSEDIPGFSYADFSQAQGGDLRFFDASGSLLPHEIDTWNSNGVSTVWVRVPALAASTTITAKYGSEGYSPSMRARDVWDDGYLGVWHLGAESGNSVQPDSSWNGKDFSVNANNSDGVASGADGVVGRAAATGRRDDGKGCFSHSDANQFFAGRSAFTVETWTWQDDHEPAQNSTLRYVLAHSGQTEESYDWRIYENNKGKLVMQFSSLGSLDGNAAKIFADDSAARPARAAWNHTAFAWDGANGQLGLYLGGNPLAIAASVLTNNWKGTMAGDKSGFNLGNHRYDNTKSFKGRIDEVRISKIARSEAWIKATHDTIANANFATYTVAGAVPPVFFAKEVNVAFTGYSGGAALANFPVLVRLSENIPGFSYGDFQIASGGDLRFFDAGGNLLAHEVDTWNESGVSTVWVKVPTLSASTAITAKYGCAEPPAVSAKDVWDADYVGVWHLGEGALPMKESSETSSDFTTAYGSTIGYAADGVVGGSVDFPAGGQYNSLVAPDHDALDGFSKFTVEVWTFQAGHKKDAGILSKRKTNRSEMAYYLFGGEAASGTKTVPICVGTNRNTGVDWTYHMPQTFGAWNHLAYSIDMTASKSNLRGFKNGKANSWVADKKFFGEMGNCASDLCLGNLDANARDSAFNGRIDEVRISKTTRSAEWIVATYETVMKPDFATYSTVNGTLSGFAAWMNAKELSGAFDETAAKDIPNGVRYAFDIDPEKGPADIGTPIIEVVRDAEGNPVVEALDLAEGRGDVTFGILATPDLSDWSQATLVPMEKFATDGFWKPAASESPTYEFPARLFFRYTIEAK